MQNKIICIKIIFVVKEDRMDVLETNDEHHNEAKDQEVEIVEKNVKGLDDIKSNQIK